MSALRPSRSSAPLALGLLLLVGACGSDPTTPRPMPYIPFFPSDASVDDASLADAGSDPAPTCNGKAVGTVDRRVRYQFATAAADAGTACEPQNQTRTCGDQGIWGAWSGDYTVETCSVEGLADCDESPHGTVQKRDRYEAASVAADKQCNKQAQERTCNDGTWGAWSGTFTVETCAVEGAQSCGDKPDGTAEERTYFKTSEVPFGTTCESEKQTRSCTDGTWSTWTGTFTKENCRVLAALSCGDSPHGTVDQRDRFAAKSVPVGQTCTPEHQTRTCTNGAWSNWSGTLTEPYCDVEGSRRCGDTLNGQQESRTYYQTASVPYGQTCVQEIQKRTCTDGTFGSWDGTYLQATCQPAAPAGCGSAAHGDYVSRERFQAAVVPFGTQCVKEQQTSTCSNGVWGSYTGTYTFETCSVAAPVGCGTAAHLELQTRERFKVASAPFGTLCEKEVQTRQCSNGAWGNWSGTFSAETCSVAPPASCDGVAHLGTQQQTRWQALAVPQGQTCKSQQQTRTCNNGVWSAWNPNAYTAASCRVRGDSCYDGDETILDGDSQSRERFQDGFAATGQTCKTETQKRLCTNGQLGKWSGTYVVEGCSVLPAPATKRANCRWVENNVPFCTEYRGDTVSSNKSSCASGHTWDETRGCSVTGSAYATCTYTPLLSKTTVVEVTYEPADLDQFNCAAKGGTWTEL